MDTEKRQSPGRRAHDEEAARALEAHRRRGPLVRLLTGRENWYRDIWNAFTMGIAIWAVITALNAADNATRAVNQQKIGRRVAVQITCAATSAVIDAGRATITGGVSGLNPDFTRNLERLGYPPKKVRLAQAQAAAESYARMIASRVERAAGPAAKGIVRPNGSLDCTRVQLVARTH